MSENSKPNRILGKRRAFSPRQDLLPGPEGTHRPWERLPVLREGPQHPVEQVRSALRTRLLYIAEGRQPLGDSPVQILNGDDTPASISEHDQEQPHFRIIDY
jgi:hypothetical protein